MTLVRQMKEAESMARRFRIEYPGAYYYVMNRGLFRRNIFLKDKDREIFLGLLGETSRRWKVEIFAYCLLDNHYHILLQTRGLGLHHGEFNAFTKRRIETKTILFVEGEIFASCGGPMKTCEVKGQHTVR